MTHDLEKARQELGIKYFLICFADLAGTPRAKLVPGEAIGQMATPVRALPASPLGST